MRVLVTGANGYLGQGIVRHLLGKDVEVVATDYSISCVDSKAELIECDLFNVKDPYRFFGEPDVLVHLAWKDGFSHYSSSHIDNLPKHYKFIESFIDSGIKRVSIMGTMHEVGFYEGSIDENTPCNPITPYGISKNALRELIQLLCDKNNVDFQWLRGFYIVGTSKNGASIFAKIVEAEESKQALFPFTMGQSQYDFIDYEDFCESVALTVIQNEVLGIINICSGYPQKLADRVEQFISDNNYRIKLNYGAYPDRPYDSKAVWGNCDKLKTIKNSSIV